MDGSEGLGLSGVLRRAHNLTSGPVGNQRTLAASPLHSRHGCYRGATKRQIVRSWVAAAVLAVQSATQVNGVDGGRFYAR